MGRMIRVMLVSAAVILCTSLSNSSPNLIDVVETPEQAMNNVTSGFPPLPGGQEGPDRAAAHMMEE